MSTEFDDSPAAIIGAYFTTITPPSISNKCTMCHVLSNGDLYKYFGCNLPANNNLINKA